MDVSFLQKNYILVAISILISVILTFFLNLLVPQNQEDRSYIKSIIISGLISAIIVYIHNLDTPIENIILDPAPF